MENIHKVLEDALPANCLLRCAEPEQLVAACRSTIFGVDAVIKHDTFANPNLMPCFRVAVQGTRSCLMLSMCEVMDYMKQLRRNAESDTSPAEEIVDFTRQELHTTVSEYPSLPPPLPPSHPPNVMR